jgi:protein-S-isoprenylcysteine O-methyltransferase Ste14
VHRLRPGDRGRDRARLRTVELVFAVGWAAFWLYWLAAAFSMKRGRVAWSRELRIRVVIIALVVVLARVGAFRSHTFNKDPWLAAVGLVLFVSGLAFAVWARLHIGRNWGTPMTRKDEPELVTSGPYHLVRHPIYSGILLAGVGTAIALSWTWLVVVGLAGVYFIYSATVEERYLTEQFPEAYPRYKRSIKMLVPFVL